MKQNLHIVFNIEIHYSKLIHKMIRNNQEKKKKNQYNYYINNKSKNAEKFLIKRRIFLFLFLLGLVKLK